MSTTQVVPFGHIDHDPFNSWPSVPQAQLPVAGYPPRGSAIASARADLSVVVPFLNPGPVVRQTVDELCAVLSAHHVNLEVIAVDDGSADGSARHLEGVDRRVRVLRLEENRGKGAAIAAGVSASAGDYIGFIDADGDIDPVFIRDYYHRITLTGSHIVFASKDADGSQNSSSPIRKVMTYAFKSTVRLALRLPVDDTQCGAKVVRGSVFKQVLPRMREDGFAFDVELFVAASEAGYTDFHAAPVEINERVSGSTVTARRMVDTAVSIARIFARKARKHYRVKRVSRQLVVAG